jgi:hypothetical protein
VRGSGCGTGLRQPSCGGTSRMMREYQVRFCERLGVKFPGPTRRVSRGSPVQTAMRNCTRDEGRSFEAGSQVLASNRCKLLSSKAMVVSVAVNVGRISRRVRLREASASEPPMGALHQRGFEPGTALAHAIGSTLAGTLVVAWTYVGPRDEMCGRSRRGPRPLCERW